MRTPKSALLLAPKNFTFRYTKTTSYLCGVELGVSFRLLLTAILQQMHWNILDILAQVESFEAEGKADAPGAA